MSDSPHHSSESALQVLVESAAALARGVDLGASLQQLLAATVEGAATLF